MTVRMEEASCGASIPSAKRWQFTFRRPVCSSPTAMVLSSFVYYVGVEVPGLVPNEEVAEVYWVSLAHLWDQRNATELSLARNGESVVFPAIRLGEHLIWGLTLRVLKLFSEALDRDSPNTTIIEE